MFKSKAFNFISAIGFFVVAVAMIVAAAFIYDQADDTTATAPATKSSPTVTTSPAPTTAQRQTQAPRATQQEARRQKDPPGLMKSVSHWLNKTFGLHLLKEETKSMISLLCGFVGTFFSFRTFLLSRRRNQLLEQSLKQRSS